MGGVVVAQLAMESSVGAPFLLPMSIIYKINEYCFQYLQMQNLVDHLVFSNVIY